ncbi:MAG: hypothetical protein K8S55_07215 [Phycisphaerae bacterium]|nr:hypothetical protein [Phycisphaerae bacterium]
MNTIRRMMILPALCLLTVVWVGGCGYTAKNQGRQGISTVCVPIWTRGADIYRRDLEIRLTEAIIKKIELDRNYKVVAKNRADTLLTGSIDRISQATLSINPDTGIPREMQITFYVSFKWEDLRRNKTYVEKKNFRVTTVYLPDAPFNEDFFRGSEDLMDKLAERIVETTEAEWGNEQ